MTHGPGSVNISGHIVLFSTKLLLTETVFLFVFAGTFFISLLPKTMFLKCIDCMCANPFTACI